MRTRVWFVAALVPLLCGRAHAQTTRTTTDDRMDQFERRLDEMERRHQIELKARDEEIGRLRAQLRQGGGAPAATTAPSAAATDRSTQEMLNEIEGAGPTPDERTRGEVMKDAATRNAFGPRTAVDFNPGIAVVSDFRGSVSSRNDNPARNRFDVGSIELDMRAAVAPIADGVLILPVSRDVDDPLFFNRDEPGDGAVNTGVELEEAYVFLHDFGVPNLTAKLGRFHLRFGRQNILHSHDWPTFDNNFVNQSFLGSESLNDSGLSLSYVVPPDLIGDNYVEAIVEIISGEGNGDEGPVLNNSAFIDSPAVNTHILWNHDVARDWNLEVGGSYLFGKHNDDNRQGVNLFGADVTLIHTDPTGGFDNQLFQAEAIYGVVDTSPIATQHSFGAYLLAQQQLNRDWYAGVRLDWTKNALDENQEVWGVSPYITWYYFEFLRFRLEYQYKAGDVPTENNLYFQVTWIFGAHPPHPYWAMR